MSTIGRAAARHQATDALGQSLLGLGGSLAWSRLTFVLLLFALPPLGASIALVMVGGVLDALGVWGAWVAIAWAMVAPVLTAPVLAGAYTTALTRHRAGDRGPITGFIKLVAKDLLRALPIGLLVGGLTCVGFALLVIPGFAVQIAFLVAAPAYVLERKGIGASMKRSLELTRGIRLRLFASLVLLGVITGVVANFFTIAVALVVSTVVQATFAVAVYLSRRQQLEDLYLAQLGAEAGYRPEEEAAPTSEQLDEAIADIRKSAARTRATVVAVLVVIVVGVVGFVGNRWWDERKKERALDERIRAEMKADDEARARMRAAMASSASASAMSTSTGGKSGAGEYGGLSTSELAEKLKGLPQGAREGELGKVLSARGVELYGPGLSGVFRQLYKAPADKRNLAVLPGLSQDLAAMGCSEALNRARAVGDETKQGEAFLASCKPKTGKRVKGRRGVELYAAALATVMAGRASEQQTESDALHEEALRVLVE